MTTRSMLVVNAEQRAEAGVLPEEKLPTEIGQCNEELATAGVLIAAGAGRKKITQPVDVP